VIGRFAARSFGKPLSSKPSNTCDATSGSSVPIGASSESLPCSTNCIAPVAVTALVIEAIQNTLSGVIASALPRARLPNAFW
jgi:hypothetical protein